MANGPRAGTGQALQGKPSQPTYLLEQAQKQGQRVREAMQKPQQAIEEFQGDISELGEFDKKIHPIYQPKVREVHQKFMEGAQQLKNRYGATDFKKQPEYTQMLQNAKRKLNNYQQSTKQLQQNYLGQLDKQGLVGHPEVKQALEENDFEKFKKATGNEQGYFNLSPMTRFTVDDLASSIDENVGRDIDYSRELGSYGQIVTKETKSPAEERILREVKTRWQDPSVREYAQRALGIQSEKEFGEEILGRLSQQQTQKAKNLPSYARDDYGYGGDEDEKGNIWSDIDKIVQQNKGQAADAIQQGADPEQAMSQLGQQLQMPMRIESGEPTFKSSGLQSMMAQVPTWEFAGDKLHFRDPESGEIKKSNEYQLKAFGVEDGRIPDKYLEKNYPFKIADVSEKLAILKEGGEYEVLKMEDIRNNPELLNQAVPVQVNKIEPFKKPPENTEVSEDEIKEINDIFSDIEGKGGEVYSIYPLNERATTEYFDNKVRTAQRFYRGGQGGQQQYNPQQQEQQDNEQRSPTNPDRLNEDNNMESIKDRYEISY